MRNFKSIYPAFISFFEGIAVFSVAVDLMQIRIIYFKGEFLSPYLLLIH